jgi:hypothetical protein
MADQHDLAQKKNDVAALADHLCPECGGSIAEVGQSEAHAEDHWPAKSAARHLGSQAVSTLNPDAARRKKLLLQHGTRVRDAHEVQ